MSKLVALMAAKGVAAAAGAVAVAVVVVGLAVSTLGNPLASSPAAARSEPTGASRGNGPPPETPPSRPPGPDLDHKAFGIAGAVTSPFHPGRVQALDVELTNPNNQPIEVTAITVTVEQATSAAGCVGTDNLVVDRQFSGTVVVPKNSTVRLSTASPAVPASQWPLLRMPNLADVNQDACKQATFGLAFTGSANGG